MRLGNPAASPRQVGLQLRADSSLGGGGQTSDLFDDQTIVECEEFEPQQARRSQACRRQIGQLHIARPRLMPGSCDHPQHGGTALIETALAQHQCRTALVAGLVAEGEKGR